MSATPTLTEHSGYICETCEGPSPLGVGRPTTAPGAAEDSRSILTCQCGHSVSPIWKPTTTHATFGNESWGEHTVTFPFGPQSWDGSRARVEVREEFHNPPKQDEPHANPVATGYMVADLDAQGCREAAAALLEAADLIDKLKAHTTL